MSFFLRKTSYLLDCKCIVYYNVLAARRGNPAARDGILQKMHNQPAKSKAVTALVVVELILSIIYLTRELLR